MKKKCKVVNKNNKFVDDLRQSLISLTFCVMKVGDRVIVSSSKLDGIIIKQESGMVMLSIEANNRSYTKWFDVLDIEPYVYPDYMISKLKYSMTVSLSSCLVLQLSISSGINLLLSVGLSVAVGVVLVLNTKEK